MTAKRGALARLILIPVLTFAVVFAAVASYTLSRPAQYSARVALIVRPPATMTSKPGAVNTDYVNLSGAMLPAVSEMVHSDAYMESVVQGVPGNPTAHNVATSSTVEIVPASVVVRVTTKGTSEEQATALATNLSNKLAKADIFGGLAQLGQVEAGAPTAQQTAPDKPLGLGLSFLVAAIAAALATQLYLMRRSRWTLTRLRQLVGQDVAVFDMTTASTEQQQFLVNSFTDLGGTDVQYDSEASRAAAPETIKSLASAPTRGTNPAVLLVTTEGKASSTNLDNAIRMIRARGEQLVGIAIV